MYYLNKRDITLGHEMVNLIWIIHLCCFTQQYGCYIICHKLFINTWLQRNNYKWKSHDDDSPCLLPTNSSTLPIYVIDKKMFNDAIYLHINQTETWTEKSCTIIVMMFSYFKLLDNQFLLLSKSVHDWKCKLP